MIHTDFLVDDKANAQRNRERIAKGENTEAYVKQEHALAQVPWDTLPLPRYIITGELPTIHGY